MYYRTRQIVHAVGGALLVAAFFGLVAWFATGPAALQGTQRSPSAPLVTGSDSQAPSSSVPASRTPRVRRTPTTPPAARTPTARPTKPSRSTTPTVSRQPTRSTTPRPQPLPTDPVCTPVQVPDELVVVSYNIKSGRWDDQNRLPAIAAALREWDADVVLLQEVDNGRPSTQRVDMAAYLGERLGMDHAFGANAQFRPGAALGNAVLSRYPITDMRNIHLPNRPGLQRRGLLRAVVEVEGRSISVYTTHLQNMAPGMTFEEAKAMRLEQAKAIVPVLAADPNPKILGGDFNSGSNSAVMTTVGRAVSDTWAAVGTGTGRTSPGHSPRVRIDYLLHRGLDPLRAAVMPTVLSDHRAVRATYRITKFGGLDCADSPGASSQR